MIYLSGNASFPHWLQESSLSQNNSSDSAAFYTHKSTYWQCHMHIHNVPITHKNTITPTKYSRSCKELMCPVRAVTASPRNESFSQPPEALNASFTWLCCDHSHNGSLTNKITTLQCHSVTIKCMALIHLGQIWKISFIQTCHTSPPLPRRQTLFTKNTEREHERTQQGLDAIGDSAWTVEQQTPSFPQPPTEPLSLWMGTAAVPLRLVSPPV